MDEPMVDVSVLAKPVDAKAVFMWGPKRGEDGQPVEGDKSQMVTFLRLNIAGEVVWYQGVGKNDLVTISADTGAALEEAYQTGERHE